MIIIELTKKTVDELIAELKEKLHERGYKDTQIERLLREVNVQKKLNELASATREDQLKLKDFTESPSFRILCLTNSGEDIVVLGVKSSIDKDGKLVSVDFPRTGVERPCLLLSKKHSTSEPDSDAAFSHINNFAPWDVPRVGVTVITGRNGWQNAFAGICL